MRTCNTIRKRSPCRVQHQHRARHIAHGHVRSGEHYRWRPILSGGVLYCGRYMYFLRTSQKRYIVTVLKIKKIHEFFFFFFKSYKYTRYVSAGAAGGAGGAADGCGRPLDVAVLNNTCTRGICFTSAANSAFGFCRMPTTVAL